MSGPRESGHSGRKACNAARARECSPTARFAAGDLREGLWRGEVHWWFSVPDDWPLISSPSPNGARFLDGEELSRLERLRGEEWRHAYFVSHTLLRCALSHYADWAPAEWRFRRERFGRPELGPEQRDRWPLRFSLAHTEGLATCAVVLENDIGVDAEASRAHFPDAIAASFAPVELRDLNGLGAESRSARAFQYWTLKEAFVKALGLGLQVPLNSFCFAPVGRTWTLTCDPEVEKSPDNWSFALFSPTHRHQAALAVRRPASPDAQIRHFWLDAAYKVQEAIA